MLTLVKLATAANASKTVVSATTKGVRLKTGFSVPDAQLKQLDHQIHCGLDLLLSRYSEWQLSGLHSLQAALLSIGPAKTPLPMVIPDCHILLGTQCTLTKPMYLPHQMYTTLLHPFNTNEIVQGVVDVLRPLSAGNS